MTGTELVALKWAGEKAGEALISKVKGWVWEEIRMTREAKANQGLADLIAQVAVVMATTPDEAAERVNTILDEAKHTTVETLFEHFRFYVEALDPAAQPFITRLTAWYLSDRRARDPFFRRVGRMLMEATEAEAQQLHEMFASAREALAGRRVDATIHTYLDISAAPERTGAYLYEGWHKSSQCIGGKDLGSVSIAEGMAALKQSGVLRGPGADQHVRFEPADNDLLAALIRVFG